MPGMLASIELTPCLNDNPEFVAKKLCSELIIVPVDYKRVSAVSTKVISVCRGYDPNMYVAGCDEGYLKYEYASLIPAIDI